MRVASARSRASAWVRIGIVAPISTAGGTISTAASATSTANASAPSPVGSHTEALRTIGNSDGNSRDHAPIAASSAP